MNDKKEEQKNEESSKSNEPDLDVQAPELSLGLEDDSAR